MYKVIITKKQKKIKKSDFIHLGIKALESRISKLNAEIEDFSIKMNDYNEKFKKWKQITDPYFEKKLKCQENLSKNPAPYQKTEREGGILGIGSRIVKISFTQEEINIIELRKENELQILKIDEIILSLDKFKPSSIGVSYSDQFLISSKKETKKLLEEIYLDKKQEEDKLTQLKSMASESIEKQREIAYSVKITQIENCPYCGNKIAYPHKDHIYPVSKGGNSGSKNLVYVCSDCNMKKSNLTLNSFIKKYQSFLLPRNIIEENLEKLGKEF